MMLFKIHFVSIVNFQAVYLVKLTLKNLLQRRQTISLNMNIGP